MEQPMITAAHVVPSVALATEAESAEPAVSSIPPPLSGAAVMIKTQTILIVLGGAGFLHIARPVVLPIVLACVGAMTLKPLIRWLSNCRIRPALGAAVVLSIIGVAAGIAFVHLGRPAMAWVNEAPLHMAELRQRALKLLPRAGRFSMAAAAVNNLGASEAEQKRPPMVEIKDTHGGSAFMNRTGIWLAAIGETLVLLYLLLASGDLFLQKLVHVMPTLGDKKRAVDVSHEIQQNISNYLFAVSLINIALGVVVSVGLYLLKVPNAAMWGMLVAVLNFVPYFGPVVGIVLLGAVGLLSFESGYQAFLPAAWYLLLHLLESNFITPQLLGRRLTLNPVAIFVSLMFWTWLWGVPGALLSVPILVSLKVVCDRVPAMSSLGELLSQ